MARFYVVLILALAIVHTTTARDLPNKNAGAGLDDQKNFVAFGGIGGFAGVGGGVGGLGGFSGLGSGVGGIGGVGSGIGGGSGVGSGVGGGCGDCADDVFTHP